MAHFTEGSWSLIKHARFWDAGGNRKRTFRVLRPNRFPHFLLLISNGEKILSSVNVVVWRQFESENSSLPLAVRVSKTRVLKLPNNKQLLDEVFVISRIIEVEVGVISRSRRLRLITLTETSIILNITKTESNNCFIIHWTQKIEVIFFASSLTPSSTKRANLTWLFLEIMHRGHTWHD